MAASLRQLDLPLAEPPPPKGQHGGARAGAGRPKAKFSHVAHVSRPAHARRFPVEVTMRARAGLHTFRCQRILFAFTKAMEKANRRALRAGQYRVVHFSIQGNHIHLLVEADDREALRSGSQGLAIRLARVFNRVFERSGKVWAERHDRRAIRSPRQLRNVLVYILQNHRKHLPSKETAASLDPCSSALWFGGFRRAGPDLAALARSPIGRIAPCVVAPKTWLLAEGWRLRGGGPIHPREAPASRPRVHPRPGLP